MEITPPGTSTKYVTEKVGKFTLGYRSDSEKQARKIISVLESLSEQQLIDTVEELLRKEPFSHFELKGTLINLNDKSSIGILWQDVQITMSRKEAKEVIDSAPIQIRSSTGAALEKHRSEINRTLILAIVAAVITGFLGGIIPWTLDRLFPRDSHQRIVLDLRGLNLTESDTLQLEQQKEPQVEIITGLRKTD